MADRAYILFRAILCNALTRILDSSNVEISIFMTFSARASLFELGCSMSGLGRPADGRGRWSELLRRYSRHDGA